MFSHKSQPFGSVKYSALSDRVGPRTNVATGAVINNVVKVSLHVTLF